MKPNQHLMILQSESGEVGVPYLHIGVTESGEWRLRVQRRNEVIGLSWPVLVRNPQSAKLGLRPTQPLAPDGTQG